MDGMKMQTCEPGFTDGRDAILSADRALTGGVNQRLIWEVFARRGLGYSAFQGSNEWRRDGREAFDLDPKVVKELKISKHMTPLINPGEIIDVEIQVVNHKDVEVTEVGVNDLVPQGATFASVSSSHSVDQNGSMLHFEIGAIPSGDTVDIIYQLVASDQLASEELFYDDMESGDDNWDFFNNEGLRIWELQDIIVHQGNQAWYVENSPDVNDQLLETIDDFLVTGEQPVCRFYQYYQTERFFDGGIISISTDGGFSYKYLPEEKFIRQGYTTKIPFGLFATRNLKAFTGNSNGWVETIIDLSEYIGQEIRVQFRFGSDDNTEGIGWFMDDFEFMDAFNYNSTACVSSAEGDEACAEAPAMGTIVESTEITAVAETESSNLFMRLHPNPVHDVLTISVTSKRPQGASFTLYNAAGQPARFRKMDLAPGENQFTMTINDLPEGFYFLKMEGESEQSIRKIIVH
jgi:uncharacterized repeat protein (TIGR01451 family)